MKPAPATLLLAFCLCAGVLQGQGTQLDRAYAAAQTSLTAGDLDGARRQFEVLSRAHPAIAELHATLGALLFQQGDFPGALRELEQAKRLKPTLPKLNGLIAMAQAETGHAGAAQSTLAETFRTANDLPVKRMSGLELERAYTSTGQHAQAVAVALELQRLFPNDPEVLYHNERIFGNFAFLTVQSLVKAAPESVWRYQAQAEAEESQGSHDAALASYGKVLQLDPHRAGVHYRMGRVLRERARDAHHPEDLQSAMTEFRAELALDPANANAAYEVGELDRLAGNLSEAKTFFQNALNAYPDFPEANLGLGTVLASTNQPAEALPYLQRALKADPSDEASWYRLAQVQRALGHVGEQEAALKEFQRLRAIGGSDTPSVRQVSQQTVDATAP